MVLRLSETPTSKLFSSFHPDSPRHGTLHAKNASGPCFHFCVGLFRQQTLQYNLNCPATTSTAQSQLEQSSHNLNYPDTT